MARLTKVLKTELNDAHEEEEEDEGEAVESSGGPAEDPSNSHEGVDIDMADIVVIDEYDSTKNETSKKVSPKALKPFLS